MVDHLIHQPVEDVWHHHFSELDEALDETIRELQNLIRLDDYHRHGHEEEKLGDTLGPFGSSNLNLSSLSKVLGSSSSRCMPEERVNRINRLLEKLEAIKKSCAEETGKNPVMDISEEEERIHEKAEEHLNRMAEIFCSLRIAQLEIRSKYHPATHDPVFANFSWRLLSPAEFRLCPPFLIMANLESDSGRTLRKIMSLLESRKPFKIAAMRTSLRKVYSPTADPSVPASMAVETLPLAMRGVFFLQTCIAAPDFTKRLFDALTSSRPTLLSLLAQKDGEDEAAFRLRAERAIRSRAFPLVSYDPDKARGFVSCFDISDNPEGVGSYTFADFALGESEFSGEFTNPPADVPEDSLVPVGEYLELVRHQRMGKFPCVYVPGPDGQALPKVVSPAVITQTSDQIHIWRTLQEIAGVDNPHVNITKASLEAAFGAEQKAIIDNMQHDMEQKQSQREQVAVASAVQQLVAKLTGVDATTIDLQSLVDGKS
ncbi:MAG: hypothetical protein AB3N33_00675 [Puniceicoccaceae bacterium]